MTRNKALKERIRAFLTCFCVQNCTGKGSKNWGRCMQCYHFSLPAFGSQGEKTIPRNDSHLASRGEGLGDSYGTGPDPTLGVPRISAKIICPDRPPYSSVGDEVLLSDSFRGGDRPGATLSLDPAAFIGIFALGVTLSHLGESAWIQRVEPKIAV
jgi:hypothetical protein